MAGVEQPFDLFDAVALFAVGDIFLRKQQIVDDRAGVGPAAEQVVIFEKRVVAVAGVRHHQRLHSHGVLFHQIGDTGIGVDHNLIRQSLLPVLITLLGFDELFAERPVSVVDWHTDAGVGVHHLLGGDDFNLMGIGVESVEFGYAVNFRKVDIEQIKCPVRSIAESFAVLNRIVKDCRHSAPLFCKQACPLRAAGFGNFKAHP